MVMNEGEAGTMDTLSLSVNLFKLSVLPQQT